MQSWLGLCVPADTKDYLVEAMPEQPCELKGDAVVPLVQAELGKRMDIAREQTAVLLEPVKLAVRDIEPLGRLHARGVGLDADGVLPGAGAEQDAIGHIGSPFSMASKRPSRL